MSINVKFPDLIMLISDIDKKYNLNNTSKEEILYHYTSIEGFMSILQNRDFWISNIRFMNDAQEFNNGCEICKQILQDRIAGFGQNLRDLEKKHKAYY